MLENDSPTSNFELMLVNTIALPSFFTIFLLSFDKNTNSNDDHQQKLNLLGHTNNHPTLKYHSSGAVELVNVAHRGFGLVQ